MFCSGWFVNDVPRGITLRDTLFRKIKDSKVLAFDIQYYQSLEEGHAHKTYKYLMDRIVMRIKLEREEHLNPECARPLWRWRGLIASKTWLSRVPGFQYCLTGHGIRLDISEPSRAP